MSSLQEINRLLAINLAEREVLLAMFHELDHTASTWFIKVNDTMVKLVKLAITKNENYYKPVQGYNLKITLTNQINVEVSIEGFYANKCETFTPGNPPCRIEVNSHITVLFSTAMSGEFCYVESVIRTV